jgi:hypothetical protein
MPAHWDERLVLKLKDCRTTLYLGAKTLRVPALVSQPAWQRQTQPNSLLYFVQQSEVTRSQP